jgi:hypothetical protein
LRGVDPTGGSSIGLSRRSEIVGGSLAHLQRIRTGRSSGEYRPIPIPDKLLRRRISHTDEQRSRAADRA